MTDRELMQQALDLLDDINQCSLPPTGIPLPAEIDHVMEALRYRIAQPEQEIESDRDHVEDDGCPIEKAVLQRFWREHQTQEPVFWATNALTHEWVVTKEKVANDSIPLYTAPPQRGWQGLTDDEIEKLVYDIRSQTTGVVATAYVARAIEVKLKEKNT